MDSLSGPNALELLHPLIAFLTSSVENCVASVSDFLLVALTVFLVSRDDLWIPSFDVVNCWLNLLAMSLGEDTS